MTIEDPETPRSESAQGNFEEFDAGGAPLGDPSGETSGFSHDLLAQLGRTIENELIPRLMLAFDSTPDGKPNARAETLAELVDDFVALLLRDDAPVAVRYVETLRVDGIPLASIYLDLLAPAARKLGGLWDEDEASFADVTIGVCRMHQVLLEFSRCFDATAVDGGNGRNALVLPAPGEQHTFGLFMVMEFLRRDGWNCYSGAPTSSDELLRLACSQEFGLIGLSVSVTDHLDEVRRLIASIRRKSDALILVGGHCFIEEPHLVKEIGADAMASDGREAVKVVRKLLKRTQTIRTA
jgi:methanogenic corrinoid protein MtbC1